MRWPCPFPPFLTARSRRGTNFSAASAPRRMTPCRAGTCTRPSRDVIASRARRISGPAGRTRRLVLDAFIASEANSTIAGWATGCPYDGAGHGWPSGEFTALRPTAGPRSGTYSREGVPGTPRRRWLPKRQTPGPQGRPGTNGHTSHVPRRPRAGSCLSLITYHLSLIPASSRICC
jgi:hypothetical protein